MINVDVPITVVNMETLVERLNDEIESNSGCEYEHSGFVDLHEQAIIEDDIYKRMQFKKYGYAVRNG